ncbi:MAG: beta/gamma crystallin domain-containing protein [Nitrospirota bacterium]|nr:beta/gamma crystallin domain-containing protein [Nitrospirota bacterium]MDP2381987.1 beta/gamma crystallin domain-containing protein [Nitrospirota bacterium]MDP3598596.1 beta/gamma crystallin domain-containing protein [Nitrospirota bacterium]
MLLFKMFIVGGLIVIGALSAEAADMELQLVDKNCWIEVFDDTKYDADDPHVKLQGPKEYASLKNLSGRDWANDIQSVIVGSSASVLAYKDKDFRGAEIAFAPGQRIPDLSNLDMSNDIESMKITCAK